MTVYSAVSASLNVTVSELSGAAVLTLTGPATVAEDTLYTYTGRLTGVSGVGLAGKSIAMSYTMGGSEIAFPTSATTDASGNYSYNVSFANPGVYTLIARWAGGSA